MSFLGFSLDFICRNNCDETKRICNKLLTEQLFVLTNTDVDCNGIIATKKKNNLLFINSFSPVVRIDFCETNHSTEISVNFQLRGITKALLYVYIIMAISFEICIINLYLHNNLTSPVLLLLPFLLVLYALTLSYLGLRVMSKPIRSSLEALFSSKTGDGSVS